MHNIAWKSPEMALISCANLLEPIFERCYLLIIDGLNFKSVMKNKTIEFFTYVTDLWAQKYLSWVFSQFNYSHASSFAVSILSLIPEFHMSGLQIWAFVYRLRIWDMINKCKTFFQFHEKRLSGLWENASKIKVSLKF